MDNLIALQIFLLIDVFIMGLIFAAAIRHAYAHFRPHKEEKTHNQAQNVTIPPEVKEKLIQASQTHFQTILNRSAIELEKDLKNTTDRLNRQLEKTGAEIIVSEMGRYRQKLDQLCKQIEDSIVKGQDEITHHQAEIKANQEKKQAELETELLEKVKEQQQVMIQNIDTKLSDAVASFLTETLQHNVDLGAQSPYLISMLEEHKDEFIKSVNNEI